MTQFSEYVWKNGVPIGQGKANGEKSYRIISDPYHKWISVEEYKSGTYTKTIYDSSLLDFRTINPRCQNAWQKIDIFSSKEKVLSLIRDHNDRALFKETYLFKKNRCIQCETSSVQGLLLSMQKMYYKELEDSFNGVILFDSNSHPIMYKKYAFSKEINDFAEVLEESWDLFANKKSLPQEIIRTGA